MVIHNKIKCDYILNKIYLSEECIYCVRTAETENEACGNDDSGNDDETDDDDETNETV